MYYIYILKCEDGSLYTGITGDIKKRLTQHYFKKKEAAKYTKSHQVKELMGLWTVPDKSQALKVERYIKSQTRKDKEQIIAKPGGCFENTPLEEMGICPEAQEGLTLKEIIGDK